MNNNYSTYAKLKGEFFTIPGTFQSTLSPRFSNVDYGANIRYREPNINHMASPPNHPFLYNYPSFCKK